MLILAKQKKKGATPDYAIAAMWILSFCSLMHMITVFWCLSSIGPGDIHPTGAEHGVETKADQIFVSAHPDNVWFDHEKLAKKTNEKQEMHPKFPTKFL